MLIHSTFTKVVEGAPQLTQDSTLHVKWYRAPHEGHPCITDRIGCLQAKQGVAFVWCAGAANDPCAGAEIGIDVSFLFLKKITSPTMMTRGIITKIDKTTGLIPDDSSLIAAPSLETSNSIFELITSSAPLIEIERIPSTGLVAVMSNLTFEIGLLQD